MTSPFLIGRGLLGTGIASHANVRRPSDRITWSDAVLARRQLASAARSVVPDDADLWSVAWCAGASTMRSSASDMSRETGYLSVFLDALAEALNGDRAKSGVVFVASSAGGIYGHGSSATITEHTAPAPTTEYALGKLEQEAALRRFHQATGMRCLTGRISNLYGTSQNLAKAQGLVSHLCRATLGRRPLIVTVPLDTRRDYVHAGDAGRRILHWIDVAHDRPTECRTKLIVSGRSATVSEILASVQRVSRLRPPVVFARGTTPDFPRYQSFRSIELTDIDAATPCRTLDVGVNEIWNSTLRSYMRSPAREPSVSIPELDGQTRLG